MIAGLSFAEIEAARAELGDRVVTTPAVPWDVPLVAEQLGADARVVLKLELLQRCGSFKLRGAVLNLLALDAGQRARGVTTASAGNHAVAIAFAAQQIGVSAKLVTFGSANPLRLELCRRYGAEVLIAETPKAAFAMATAIAETEGRLYIHPFEGGRTMLGTATVGLELSRQVEPLDAVIVPVGGGGLAGGIGAVLKAAWPDCAVYGVEPVGAPTMYRSLAAGMPQALDRIETIADSLSAPRTMPISFAVCREVLAGVELVDDGELRAAMRIMLAQCKLAVEPAAAAAMAALLGPLRSRLRGARVGLIVCGSNIDAASYGRLIAED